MVELEIEYEDKLVVYVQRGRTHVMADTGDCKVHLVLTPEQRRQFIGTLRATAGEPD